MKTKTAVVAAVAALFLLTACGSDDETSAPESTTRPAGSVASSVVQRAVDAAKLGTFVATFRTGYPNLADGRDDASIEAIVTETCPLIDDGASDEEINSRVAELSANGAVTPTDQQVDRITQLVRAAC
jgi:hypothetical protein